MRRFTLITTLAFSCLIGITKAQQSTKLDISTQPSSSTVQPSSSTVQQTLPFNTSQPRPLVNGQRNVVVVPVDEPNKGTSSSEAAKPPPVESGSTPKSVATENAPKLSTQSSPSLSAENLSRTAATQNAGPPSAKPIKPVTSAAAKSEEEEDDLIPAPKGKPKKPETKPQKNLAAPAGGKGKVGVVKEESEESVEISKPSGTRRTTPTQISAAESEETSKKKNPKAKPTKTPKATTPKVDEEEDEEYEDETPSPTTNSEKKSKANQKGATPLPSSSSKPKNGSLTTPGGNISSLSVKGNSTSPAPSKRTKTPSSGQAETEEESDDESGALLAAVDEEFAAALKNLTQAGVLSPADYSNKRVSELFANLLENVLKSNVSSENDQQLLVHKAALEFTRIFKAKAAINHPKDVNELLRQVSDEILATQAAGALGALLPIGVLATSKPLEQAPPKPKASNVAVKGQSTIATLPTALLSTALVPVGPEVDNSLQQLNVINLQAIRFLQNANLLGLNKSIVAPDGTAKNSSLQKGENPPPPLLPVKQLLELSGANATQEISQFENENGENGQQDNATLHFAIVAITANVSESDLETESNNTAEEGSAAPEPAESPAAAPPSRVASIPVQSVGSVPIISAPPIPPRSLSKSPNPEPTSAEPQSESPGAPTVGNESANPSNESTVALIHNILNQSSVGEPANGTSVEEISEESDVGQNTSSTFLIHPDAILTTTESFWIASDNTSPDPTRDSKGSNETRKLETTSKNSAGATEEISSSPEPKTTVSKSNAMLVWSFKIVDPQTEWDSELANKESFQFKALYGSLVADLKTIFKKLEPERFVEVSIKRFSQGSVVVEGETELKERVEYGQLQDNFLKLLQEQENKIGGRIVDPITVVFDGRPNAGLARFSGSSPNGTPAWVIGISVGCALLAAIVVSSVLIILRHLRRRRFDLSPVDLQAIKLTSSLHHPINSNPKRNPAAPSSSVGTDNPFMSLHKNAQGKQDPKHSVRSQPDGRRQRPTFDYRYYQTPYVTPGAYARPYLTPAPNFFSYPQQNGYGYW